jgi:hypothetical protein
VTTGDPELVHVPVHVPAVFYVSASPAKSGKTTLEVVPSYVGYITPWLSLMDVPDTGDESRPRPWPSFLVGQLNATVNHPQPWPSFPCCGGMKPTYFAIRSSSILQLVVFSGDSEWCSYC